MDHARIFGIGLSSMNLDQTNYLLKSEFCFRNKMKPIGTIKITIQILKGFFHVKLSKM